MKVDLTASIVRILTSEGATVGTGFLVSNDGLIATCAHVVEGSGAEPGDIVRVIFHIAPGAEESKARVETKWWRRSSAEDVAILRLEGALPGGVIPVILSAAEASAEHTFRAFGYPVIEGIEGVWATGEIKGLVRDKDGRQVLQIASPEIARGISGSPVWDEVRQCVVGMVTATYYPDSTTKHRDTGFATSAETLWAVCPELKLSDLCPYLGLAAFAEADAGFFFGRDKLVDDLVKHLRNSPRFLAVVGPSGSGKSSTVQAGLFPSLRRGQVSGSEDWHLLSFRPGVDPFIALTNAGIDVSQDGDLQTIVLEFLAGYPQAKRLVLFIDQFEELFALCSQPVRERFLDQLITLLESELRVTIILALRADFYSYLWPYQPLVNWFDLGQINVPSMGLEERKAAIEEPALKLGFYFERGLVDSIAGEAGKAEHPLPLLESALTQLWKNRKDGVLTYAAYQVVGQVGGAIGQWAEDTYSGLSKEEQSLAHRIFTRLVHYGEGEMTHTRHQRSLSELMVHPGEQETVHQLVQQLADARLLVTEGDSDTKRVEIIHDALLREWSRLERWLTEQQEFYLWQQRLYMQLQTWQKQNQDDSALLRGKSLDEAERQLEMHPGDLNLAEQSYIQTSIALRDREIADLEKSRKRRLQWLTATAFILFILTIVAGWGWQSSARNEKALATQVSVRIAAEADADTRRIEAQQAALDEAAARQQADTEREKAEKSERQDRAREFTTLALFELEQPTEPTGDLAILLAREAISTTLSKGEGILPEADVVLRRALANTPYRVALRGHTDRINAATWSPDGQTIATASDDGDVCLWDVVTGQTSRCFQIHGEKALSVVWEPNNNATIATVDDAGAICLWNTITGQEVRCIETLIDEIFSISWHPYDDMLLTTTDNKVHIWNPMTGRRLYTLDGHADKINSATWSPDGRMLATASADQTVRFWNSSTGEELELYRREYYTDSVTLAVWSPNGHVVAILSKDADQAACVYNLATRSQGCIGGVESWPLTAKWNPNGNMVIFAFMSGEVVLLDTVTSEVTPLIKLDNMFMDQNWTSRFLSTKPCFPNSLEWSPDNQTIIIPCGGHFLFQNVMDMDEEIRAFNNPSYSFREISTSPSEQTFLAITGKDNAPLDHKEIVTLWSINLDYQVLLLEGHNGQVLSVDYNPNRQLIVTTGEDKTARVWNLVEGKELFEFRWLVGHVESAIWSPDGETLITTDDNREVHFWNISTKKELPGFYFETGWPEQLAWSPDGTMLASTLRFYGGMGDQSCLWDFEQEQFSQCIEGSVGRAASAAWSPNSQMLITAVEDGTVRVWDITTDKQFLLYVDETVRITSMAWSPDGQVIAIARSDNTVQLWDAIARHEIRRLEGHTDLVFAAVWSPDGKTIATASDDRTARLWDVTTGQELHSFTAHQGRVSDIAWILNGQMIVTVGGNGTIRVWDVSLWVMPIEDLLALSEARIQRESPILNVDETSRFFGEERFLTTRESANDYYERGIAEKEMEKYETSLEDFKRALELNPEFTKAYLERGQAYMHLERYEEAIADLSYALELNPRNADAYHSQGHAYRLIGEQETALENFNQALDLLSTNSNAAIQVYRSRGQLFLDLGRYEAASSDYNKLVELVAGFDDIFHIPGNDTNTYRAWFAQIYIERGRAYAGSGEYGSAIADFETALELYPDIADYLQQQLGLQSSSLRDLELVKRHTDARNLVQEGWYLANHGNTESAMTKFRQSYEPDPGAVTRFLQSRQLNLNWESSSDNQAQQLAYLGLMSHIELLAKQGKIQEAITNSTKMRELNPPLEFQAAFWNNICWYGSIWGYTRDAMNSCEQAVELDPTDGTIRDSRGLAYALIGNYAEAIEDFTFAINWAKVEQQSEEFIREREAWVAILEQDHSPFDAETLEKLKNE
ncbi:MAG: tetratricopeptide repeat protein [Aestuariibacter sp.]|nr:tetratricopeptide repeat protein [Aestuariibacter sp.]